MHSSCFLILGTFTVIWVLALDSYSLICERVGVSEVFTDAYVRLSFCYLSLGFKLTRYVYSPSMWILLRLLLAISFSSFRKPYQSLARNLPPMFRLELREGIMVQMASFLYMETNNFLADLNPEPSDRFVLLSCWTLLKAMFLMSASIDLCYPITIRTYLISQWSFISCYKVLRTYCWLSL